MAFTNPNTSRYFDNLPQEFDWSNLISLISSIAGKAIKKKTDLKAVDPKDEMLQAYLSLSAGQKIEAKAPAQAPVSALDTTGLLDLIAGPIKSTPQKLSVEKIVSAITDTSCTSPFG